MKIAFVGKMFSGKSTAAEYYVEKLGYTQLAFARPVKELSAKILSLVESEIGFRLPTTVVNGSLYPTNVVYSPPKMWTFEDVEENKGDPAIRKLLQLVGTELGREYIGYKDVWVDILRQRAQGLENVVVDDCRFPNEANALREEGFMLVRLLRNEEDRIALMKQKYPTTWEDIFNHPSETSLDNFEADVVLSADSINDLRRQLDMLVK